MTAIASGQFQSLAVKNGNVYAWGGNFWGQLGDGTGNQHLTPELIDPTDLKNIIAVAAGSYGNSSYALASDGSIWDWGWCEDDELGIASSGLYVTTPQHLLPPAGYAFTSISANSQGAIAILTAIPEPGCLSVLGLMLIVLGRRRRRILN